jgi:RNA polymerase sigma factor (sigma-70 family)
MAQSHSELKDATDAALVARCLNHSDAAAWEVLVHRYQRLVYAIVRRIGLDEHMAADVFQTVFERLMAHLPRLTDPDRLQAWIVTTTKREALLQRKRGMRNVSITSDNESGDESSEREFVDDALLPEDALAELQMQTQIRNAMARLDPRCHELLTMLYVEGDDKIAYEEVSARLDMPIGSIGPTRSRCLEKLRKLVI